MISRCVGAILFLAEASSEVAPLLGDGSSVDWWFAYKLNTHAYPNCSTQRECIFGGDVQDYSYGYGQQYLLASSSDSSMELHTDCLGTGSDPVSKTFDQIYGGVAPNYVIWNDQFYREPLITLSPACSTYSSDPTSCSAPWGHSKGALAWDSEGNGFVMQVTTPSWPGSGSPNHTRTSQGNTLGCIVDDDVLVAQHFFALRLTASDTKAVLRALQVASVVTDPLNEQLVKISNSPSDIADLVNGLGQLDDSTTPFQASLSTAGVKLIAKPHSLEVPAWQMVSSVLQVPLRTATWWASPAIPSAQAGTPGCWSSDLATPMEVQIATSGQWQGTSFGLKGGLGTNYNHAKLGHSLTGTLAIMGDMNQMGSYSPETRKCSSSQNSRGGLFFVLDDSILHSGFQDLMTGDTAPYVGETTTSTTTTQITPVSDCGNAGTAASVCGASAYAAAGCVYVPAGDADSCGVKGYGCYRASDMPTSCPEAGGGGDSCGGAGIRSNSCRSSTKVAAGCVYVYSGDASACEVDKWGCYSSVSLPSSCPDKSSATAFLSLV